MNFLNSKNVTISMHPRDAFQIDFFYVSELTSYNKVKKQKPQFGIGNIVRVSIKKSAFHRSYNILLTQF